MKILLMSLLMLPLLALNPTLNETSIEVVKQNGCSASVDCNNDGVDDYSMPVDCEIVDDLEDQFEDSCS